MDFFYIYTAAQTSIDIKKVQYLYLFFFGSWGRRLKGFFFAKSSNTISRTKREAPHKKICNMSKPMAAAAAETAAAAEKATAEKAAAAAEAAAEAAADEDLDEKFIRDSQQGTSSMEGAPPPPDDSVAGSDSQDAVDFEVDVEAEEAEEAEADDDSDDGGDSVKPLTEKEVREQFVAELQKINKQVPEKPLFSEAVLRYIGDAKKTLSDSWVRKNILYGANNAQTLRFDKLLEVMGTNQKLKDLIMNNDLLCYFAKYLIDGEIPSTSSTSAATASEDGTDGGNEVSQRGSRSRSASVAR